MKNIKKKTLPLAEVYGHLEPGPVVLLSTADKNKINVMAMSWHTMIDFIPPIIACVVSNADYTFNLLKKTKECVINIPTVEIAEKVIRCGSTTGEKIDKFKTIGLTSVPASKVKAPLVAECYVNIECKVIDMKMAEKYNLFILQALKAWINPAIKSPRTIHHRGKGIFMVAGKTFKRAFRVVH